MELIKNLDSTTNVWTLTSPEGYVITSWNENDDIKKFNSFSIAYCPLDTDFSQYRLITELESELLYAQQIPTGDATTSPGTGGGGLL